MKFKNILFKVVAVVTATASCIATFSGCEGNHQHSVSKWTITQTPTCVEEGERQGTCTDCGDIIIENIPVDSLNHVYGEWDIAAPTNAKTGKAVKTCTLNASHDRLEVILPVLSSAEYEKSVVTAATPIREGVDRYTLSHSEGDIVFEVTSPVREIKSLLDAVEVASALSSDIRKAEGTVKTNSYNTLTQQTNAVTPTDYYYEFGDNYTHVKSTVDATTPEDVISEERWCSSDENGVWCLMSNNGGDVVEDKSDASTKYFNGLRYVIVNASGTGVYYGAESFLAGLYAVALKDENQDAIINKPKVVEGAVSCTFEFGYMQDCSITASGEAFGLFSKVYVSFTLKKDTYELDEFTVKAITYQNTDDGEVVSWELDANGCARIKEVYDAQTGNTVYEFNEDIFDPEKNPEGTLNAPYTVVREIYTVKQTSKAEAEALGWEVPQNPYNRNSKLATSFKVYTDTGVEITENYVVESSNANAFVYLTVRDIFPSTADLGSVDSPTFWLVTDKGEVEIDYGTINSHKVIALYSNANKSVQIKSNLGGEITILMKTSLVTKTLKFNFNRVAPSKITPSVYEYNQGSYVLTAKDTATVYVGQTLRFTVNVPADETTSADSSFATRITEGNAESVVLGDTENADIKTFTASEAGTYKVRLTSTLRTSVYTTITVTVSAPPSMSSILSGTYSGKVNYPNIWDVTVTFSSQNECTVSVPGQSETLSVTVVNGNISTEHKSGAELGMSLTLNEAYDLVLLNPTGYDNITENVILNRQS